jgi:hypothetical protein
MNVKSEMEKIREETDSPALRDFLLTKLALKCKDYNDVKRVVKQITNKTQVEWLESLPKIQKLKKKD